ncbi:MAG: hypothetical protein SNJ82_06170 [Gemmataceae bacterium]
MKWWRLLGWLALVSVAPAWAQGTDLSEQVKPSDCFLYSLEMKLEGELRIKKQTGPARLKLKANAQHRFSERVLASSSAIATRTVRHYEQAKVTIDLQGNTSQRTLRPSRKLIVAQRHDDQPLVYSPAGALQRGELEAVADHFDTLLIAGLLPGKSLQPKETWEISKAVAGPLCHLDGVTEGKLEGQFLPLQGDQARLAITGTVSGVEKGAQVKCEVVALAQFDLKEKRLVSLSWEQRDKRDQGPVSPAGELYVHVQITRKCIDTPNELNDVAIISVPDSFTPPAAMTYIEHRDAKDRYSLLHHRDWQLTALTPEHAVWRLVERGEFIAQATVTPWTKAAKGKADDAEEFKRAMNNTSGWRPEREIQAGKVESSQGKSIYRFSVLGQLDGVEVLQNFFLISNDQGDQVVLTVTTSPKNAEKLGAKDLSLAGSLELPAPAEKK